MPTNSETLLKTYQSKRDFTKTAEPSGTSTGKRKTEGLSFVVQKHDATRLHYDLRLELDGVLVSWAVTRGPSTNPADKRLAVHVEDHPLDYGGFEGTIPEAEYGGGTVMLWDQGTWEPIGDPHEGLKTGDLKFTLYGKRMKGEWVLVHMKGRDSKTRTGSRQNWLLIKHRDKYATDTDGLTDKFTTSVETGRDLDGIAKGLKSRKKSSARASKVALAAVKPDAIVPARPKADRSTAVTLLEFTDDMGIAAAERLGIKLTHPEKVVYAEGNITKAQLVAYYDAVSGPAMRHLAERPLSLLRRPTGSAKTFFQKHDSGGFPDAFKKVKIPETTGDTDIYLYIDDPAGLAASVQMSALELHIWGSHIDKLEYADRIIFDIDPDEGLDFNATRQAAIDIRDRLGKWGLESFPMVTGGKGIHVIAPLRRTLEWPEIKLFCRTFAEKLAQNEPDRFTANIRKATRKGKMFVDYLRNERGATAVAPYSTRAKPGAPVAVPVSWAEVATLHAANAFSLGEAAARAQGPDPWPAYFDLTQSITKAMLSSVAGDKM